MRIEPTVSCLDLSFTTKGGDVTKIVIKTISGFEIPVFERIDKTVSNVLL